MKIILHESATPVLLLGYLALSTTLLYYLFAAAQAVSDWLLSTSFVQH